MKITAIKLYHLNLPCADPDKGYASIRGTFYQQEAVIVELICDNGLVGWGEHTPIGATYIESCSATTLAAMNLMAPAIMDQDPRSIAVIQSILAKQLKGHFYAKAAIDMACWDLLGKSVDLPIYQLLGGRHMASAPMYGVINALPDPQEACQRFSDLRDKGYTFFQVKAGDAVLQAVDRVNAISSLLDYSTEKIFVDGNTQWSKHDALTFHQHLREKPFILEQPCHRYEDCLDVKRHIDRPMKLDESLAEKGVLLKALSDMAMEVACIKISYYGGLTGARLARDMCMAHGIICQIEDTWGTEITTSAYAHLAINTPEKWFYCTTDLHNYNSLHIAESGTGPIVENGCLRPAELPGLGVTPDRKKLGDPVAAFR